MKYGTEAQKQHYLPRLAKGVDIPCFALTSPQAGSDAASMPDRGVVCGCSGDGYALRNGGGCAQFIPLLVV
jgi:acyl-CoA dehydrogenase